MESFEPKKLALIRVLQILERHSDCEHPIKHDIQEKQEKANHFGLLFNFLI